MTQNFEEIGLGELTERVKTLKSERYRLGQICATNVEGGVELLYSFDKDHELLNIRVNVPDGEEVPSITGIYWPAFVYENESHDLFGVRFKDSELDYGGRFFKLSRPTPWRAGKEGGE
jgi:ech hydrogenase subunit D